jgi:hypothetical protein
MLRPVSICLILSRMSKLDQIRANALATRAAKNDRANPKPPHKLLVAAKEAVAVARGEAKSAKVTVFKRGRPLAKDAAKALMKTRPWLLEGMSRASWYRRQKDIKK